MLGIESGGRGIKDDSQVFGLRSEVSVSKVRKSGEKKIGGDGGSHAKSEQHIQHPPGPLAAGWSSLAYSGRGLRAGEAQGLRSRVLIQACLNDLAYVSELLWAFISSSV